jgi:hypothetical protein
MEDVGLELSRAVNSSTPPFSVRGLDSPTLHKPAKSMSHPDVLAKLQRREDQCLFLERG